MSSSSSEFEALSDRFQTLCVELAGLANATIDSDRSTELSNRALGEVLAALVALYAEKVQTGQDPVPFGANSRPAATDVAIVCTALMDCVGLELIELGGWQTMSGMGKLKRS